MAKRRLTDRLLRVLRPRPARYEVWDAATTGFGVRVATSGKISFILMARYPGLSHAERRSIGEYPGTTLAEAREVAQDWKKSVAKGIDPAVELEQQRQAEQRKHAHSFAAVAEDYIAHIKRKKLRRAHEMEKAIRRDFIPAWGDRPVADITRSDVMAIINAALRRDAPFAAHHAYSRASALFNWASEQGLVEYPATAHIRASRVIGPKVPRSRVLDDAELRAVWAAAEETGYPFGPFVQLLALTGARRSEVAGATWHEFDLDKRLWVLAPERMKAGATHTVPLSDDAMALLEGLPRFQGGDFLFSYDGGRSPINGFSKSKARFDRVVQRHLGDRALVSFRLHDVRRSVRTCLSALGVPSEVAELVIGHQQKGLHRVYDQHAYEDEKRDALQRWASKLRSIVQPPPANIVTLARR